MRVRSLGQEDPLQKEMATHSSTLARKISWTEGPGGLLPMGLQKVGHDWATSLSLSLVAQLVKNLPAMQETWVQFLGREDPLEKGMATHFSILAWRIPWTEDPSGLQSMRSQRVGHDWVTFTLFIYLIIRKLSQVLLFFLTSIFYYFHISMKPNLDYSLSFLLLRFSSVPSPVRFFAIPWTAACQASLSITNTQCLFKLMSIESVMPSNHLILCHPLLLPPPIFPSIGVFSNESVLPIRWPKYWSFSFSISSSSEHPGLISFRMDRFDLLAVQGTLKSLLQHHNLKASILPHSAFFIVQLSHPYMTTGKTIALTRWIFVGKLTSLLLNTLSRLVTAFLPRSKCLLISWLQSSSAVLARNNSIHKS